MDGYVYVVTTLTYLIMLIQYDFILLLASIQSSMISINTVVLHVAILVYDNNKLNYSMLVHALLHL